MLKLKKRITLRIPDPLAVIATLALVVAATVSMPGDRLGFGDDTGAQSDSLTLPVRAEQAEVSSEATGQDRGFKLRLLLFRRG